jgi:hypothetical protein
MVPLLTSLRGVRPARLFGIGATPAAERSAGLSVFMHLKPWKYRPEILSVALGHSCPTPATAGRWKLTAGGLKVFKRTSIF